MALANFTCLDELTQVIYQGIHKFVVLSTVSDDKWDIYLGLAKSKGRWWHGYWTEKDVHHNFGSKSSDKILEAFADKLAELFIQGQICVTDWSSEKGANIKFTLGPANNKPTHVDLVEMSPEEAAAHATTVFVEIALQAQSRKCRLYPSSTDYQFFDSKPRSSNLAPTTSTSHAAGSSKRKERTPEPEIIEEEPAPKAGKANARTANSANESAKDKAAQREIESLKSQLKQATAQAQDAGKARTSATPTPAPKPVPSMRPHKGTSLANPNKKARKYQALEFGSDDEE